MDRARRAGLTALIVVAMVATASGPVGSPILAAAVGWPTSALVLSEIQTGGVSASDEFVEIANQGATAVDLAGLELVYATSSGSTVTRKATWDASTVVAPGRRLLVANASGSAAAVADVVFVGGFAASGGALALRIVGGSVVDSVGWGDAANEFVEGTAAGAPPASSSLERMPGGAAGNTIDTNDNASDWFVQILPSPQRSSDLPVPPGAPTASPATSPTPASSPTPTPAASSTPTPMPILTPTPTASPTPSPLPAASPTPPPPPLPIGDVRGLPDGTTVTVEGVLTTALGELESGRGGFIQDLSGGIAVYLDATPVGSWPAGSAAVLHGSLSSRFSQRTLRLAETGIEHGVQGSIPAAMSVATGDAGEPLEGTRVSVGGTIIGSPSQLADGIGITLDDGSGPLRAVIGSEALAGQAIASGMTAIISGPLGQRDSSGAGSAGYRIHATLSDEFMVAEPTPTSTPTPSPSSSPTRSPTPTPRSTSSPAPTSVSPPPVTAQTVAAVRGMAVGARVSVTAVVMAEQGRLGTPALIALGDDTAGIAVRLPTGAGGFPEGTLLEVSGTLAAPYGQLEIRAAANGVHALGTGSLPSPIAAAPGGLDETVEGRLVTATGTLSTKPKRSADGDLTIVLERSGAASITIVADVSSRLAVDGFTVGATYRVVGVVGQRATRKGSLDGYRLCPRDPVDAVALAGVVQPSGGTGSTTQPRPTGSAGVTGSSIEIAKALGLADQLVTIEAIVTAPATLLDATGRRIVVQDRSAAIELLLPVDVAAPSVGTRIRAEGRIGRAYGAPRLRAERLTTLGGGPLPAPLTLRGAPGHAQEWRLVTVAGRIDDVRKLGDRWRAELLVAGSRVVVVGQPGSGIAVSTLTEGRTATVTGIVRRPFPTASDQRYAVIPRTRVDLRVTGSGTTGNAQGSRSPARSGVAAGVPVAPGSAAEPSPVGPVSVDLIDLAAFSGQEVRVGGLVVDLRPDGLLLDDGTAVGLVVLRGAAQERLLLLEPDDAINATGHVEQLADGLAVVVDDPGGILQAGDPVPSATGSLDNGDATIRAPGSGGSALASFTAPSTHQSGFLDGTSGIGAGLAGIGALVALSLASMAVTLGRRAHARRRLEQAAVAVEATLEASQSPPAVPRSAERDVTTIHSA